MEIVVCPLPISVVVGVDMVIVVVWPTSQVEMPVEAFGVVAPCQACWTLAGAKPGGACILDGCIPGG